MIVAYVYNNAGAVDAAFVTRAVQFEAMLHAAPCQATSGDMGKANSKLGKSRVRQRTS